MEDQNSETDQNQNIMPTLNPVPVPEPTPTVTAPTSNATPSAAAAQPGKVINLDDVESGYSAFLRKRWWMVILLLIVSVGVCFLNIAYGIIIFVMALAAARYFYENDLFKAFATTNGFSFVKKGQLINQTGLIFNIGRGQRYEDVVTGSYQGHPLLLFIYRYTIGYGRNSHTFHRGVMSINFGTRLPAFVLRRHHLAFLEEEGESLKSRGYTEKINLEGDFNKHFQVFIRPTTQDDVLCVLTPDIMEMLIGLDKYEVEMTDNGDLNVYSRSYITKKQGLIDIFKIIEAIAPKIGDYANRQKVIGGVTQPIVDEAR